MYCVKILISNNKLTKDMSIKIFGYTGWNINLEPLKFSAVWWLPCFLFYIWGRVSGISMVHVHVVLNSTSH